MHPLAVGPGLITFTDHGSGPVRQPRGRMPNRQSAGRSGGGGCGRGPPTAEAARGFSNHGALPPRPVAPSRQGKDRHRLYVRRPDLSPGPRLPSQGLSAHTHPLLADLRKRMPGVLQLDCRYCVNFCKRAPVFRKNDSGGLAKIGFEFIKEKE
jgi:hypothetical protein